MNIIKWAKKWRENTRETGTSRMLPINPLLIDLVLERVLNFCDYESIKQSRSVCRKWKHMTDPFFIKRSVFSIGSNAKKVRKIIVNSSVDIHQVLRSFDFVNFTAFKFELALLRMNAFENYFTHNCEFLTHLEIINGDPSSLKNEYFRIDNLIGINLKSIIIKKSQNPEYVIISLEKLVTVPQIHLEHCVILMNCENFTISPKVLTLVNVSRKRHGQMIQDNNINEMINFSALQKLHLEFVNVGFDPPVVNLSDCVNLQYLLLSGVTICLNGRINPKQLTLVNNRYRNVRGSIMFDVLLNDYLNSGCVDKITLGNREVILDFCQAISISELYITFGARVKNSYKTEHQMNIQKLSIEDDGTAEIDLCELPKSLESLHITNYSSMRCTVPVCLPNLRKLFLHQGPLRYVSNFKPCQSLVDVSVGRMHHNNIHWISSGFENVRDFSFSRLPMSTKRLFIHAIYADCTDIMEFSKRPFDLVVVADNNTKRMMSWFNMLYFPVQLFVFHLHEGNEKTFFSEMEVEKLIDFGKKMKGQQIAFGPVKVKGEKMFKRHGSATSVGKCLQYYLMVDKEMKTISKIDFDRLSISQ